MTNDFSVIGHDRDDENALLLIDNDGQHYAYDLPHDRLVPVVPDDTWVVDGPAGDSETGLADASRAALR
jgi:hypothetical protein